MTHTVVGLFSKQSEAQEAVEQLTSKGFSKSNIDLSAGTSRQGMNSTGNSQDFDADNTGDGQESGISKFFKNLFGSDDNEAGNDQASKYSSAASRGSSIVTVHAQSADEAEKAADLLDQYGAINVDDDGYDDDDTMGASPVGMFNETAGASASTVNTDMSTEAFDNTGKMSAKQDTSNDTGSIKIIEEQMNVGKRSVETGGARLRSRIVERPVEEHLRLKEERVYVNRNPVNRTATSADFDTFKEGEMEMKEYAEVPVVSKEARVVEEVSLGKETSERDETIRDTVRKTEVDVEQIPGSTTKGLSGDDMTGNRKNN